MMAALKKWYDRLDDILMCSVCLEVPESKILQCTNGHIFCPFCKGKLQLCPLCQSGFIGTRNIVAENIIDSIESSKVRIDSELKSIEAKLLNTFEEEQKKKCPDKEVKTVSSQTNYSMCPRVVSNSTQTDIVSFTNSMEKIKKKPPKKSVILYPCLIGSCLLELPYMDLIKHLTMCHKGTFYQVEQSRGIFTDKCIIETDILPKRMDFTFLIKNMGLFFFNVTIHDDGLAATVRVADHMTMDRFEYHIAIANKRRLLNGRNLVTSCRFNEKPAAASRVVKFGKEKLPMIGHESIECTLTIQRCKLGARES